MFSVPSSSSMFYVPWLMFYDLHSINYFLFFYDLRSVFMFPVIWPMSYVLCSMTYVPWPTVCCDPGTQDETPALRDKPGFWSSFPPSPPRWANAAIRLHCRPQECQFPLEDPVDQSERRAKASPVKLNRSEHTAFFCGCSEADRLIWWKKSTHSKNNSSAMRGFCWLQMGPYKYGRWKIRRMWRPRFWLELSGTRLLG